MNTSERLQLEKMIAANGTEDCTDIIRQTRHSSLIRDDVSKLLKLKKEYSRLAKTNPSQFDQICTSRCSFLFMNYTDIYNRVFKDEIDLQILDALLQKLSQIENGNLDQHEASFEVGKILKSMYIDSALRKSENLEKKHNKEKASKQTKEPKKPKVKNISYQDFLRLQGNN